MGKKIIQTPSAKISKKNNHQKKQNNNNFSSLIKVLKPKVYITDASSFKKLVQELTGNNLNENVPSAKITTFSSSLEPLYMVDDKNLNLNSLSNIEEEETSKNSFEISSLSLSPSCYYAPTMNHEDMVYGESAITDMQKSLENIIAYQNLESVLFDDTDPNQYQYDECCAQIYEQQQVDLSIYDYELYGLI
ncbi:hypothetical protein PIB30_064041 [Stylosanthes scabra]|uniref:VQ domain-containing protein n=1 Tax=Stylosanthes scabra TaxID=79078 RepID=A0ABU6WLH8_9FABA|nr:hypothetical protein [Stylosanthes scabra]